MTTQNHPQFLTVDQIVVLNNYRKNFASEDLQELAESICQHGILQALTVRPHKEDEKLYELVIGERRLRAAILVGRKEVPANVRILTDEEADEVRLIENIQRQDVHPVFEAEGFLRLVKNGKSYKEIADKVGKSETYVTQRLSLNTLIDHWKTMFLEGGLNLSGAFQIARLGTANQEKLTTHSSFKKENLQYEGQYMKVIAPQDIKEYATRNFFLNLHEADFKKDDPDLYPEAGSCLNCSRRTGCNQLLFAELTKVDYCQESACFEEKVQRHLAKGMHLLTAENIPFHQVTTKYFSNASVLNMFQYKKVEEVDEETEKGIIVEGEFVGRIINIKVNNKVAHPSTPESQRQSVEDAKKQRRALIRSNKIKKLSQRIAGELIIDQFKRARGRGDFYARMLNYLIMERLGYAPNKETVDHLIQRYGWKIPMDRTYDSMPNGTLEKCIQDTPISRKVELLADTFVFQKATAEYGSEIVKLAEYLKVDYALITSDAAGQVDAKKANKNQKTFEQPLAEAA